MRALVLQHEHNKNLGLIGEWATHRSVELTTVISARDDVPDPEYFNFIVVLGSRASVYDTSVQWIPVEVGILERAIAQHVPVFGVCFGAQLLAHALGGRVAPLGVHEFAWQYIDTSAPQLISSGPWWENHTDTFTVPPGGLELARTTLCPQAFAHGPHLGVQFHPEISFEMHQAWTQTRPEEVIAFGLDPDTLVEQTGTNAERARPAVRRMLDAFTSRLPQREHHASLAQKRLRRDERLLVAVKASAPA